MEVQNGYDEWSGSYDSDENLTRDLDRLMIRSRLGGLQFDSILEAGCGTGKNTSFLAQIGGSVRAVDFSEGMIAIAREKIQAENVRFSLMDITQPWVFEAASFDLITSSLVLEHIQDLNHVFREAARTLRPGGRLFIDELHPFRQYDGGKAGFYREEQRIEIDSFIHHISDFYRAGMEHDLSLIQLDEYWHQADRAGPPRLLSLMFERC